MITLAASALLVVGAVLFTLLIRSRDIPEPEPPSPTQHLEERKAAIYENLRDLQFEYRLGKLSDADYQQTKTDLQKELAAVLAAIDKAGGKAVPPRAAAATPAVAAAAAKRCPHCGATFDQALKFCGECGKAMMGGEA